MRSFVPRGLKPIALLTRYGLSIQVILRSWIGLRHDRTTLLLLHDNLEPLGRRAAFLPKSFLLINYWWNDASEARAAASQYSLKVRNKLIIHIAGHGEGGSIPNTSQQIQIWPNFCLLPVGEQVLDRNNLDPVILFLGELRLELPGVDHSRNLDREFDNALWIVAEELAHEGIRNWQRLKADYDLEARFRSMQHSGDVENRVDLQYDFVAGNRLRFFLIQKLLHSELSHQVRLGGPTWPILFPRLKDTNLLGLVPNHKTNLLYKVSKVVLDLGCRSLNAPIDCYERSMQIITNGPGFFRLNDFPDSTLLDGVESARSFFQTENMKSVLLSALNGTEEQYFADAHRVASNYEELRAQSWDELIEFSIGVSGENSK